jgi:hypothetical protein
MSLIESVNQRINEIISTNELEIKCCECLKDFLCYGRVGGYRFTDGSVYVVMHEVIEKLGLTDFIHVNGKSDSSGIEVFLSFVDKRDR